MFESNYHHILYLSFSKEFIYSCNFLKNQPGACISMLVYFCKEQVQQQGFNLLVFGKYISIMEEKTTTGEQRQRQKLPFIRYEIQEFASKELRNCEILKIMTDQFKAKQAGRTHFQKEQFSQSIYAQFTAIHDFLEKIITRMTSFPILDKIPQLLSLATSQYMKVFRVTSQKWEREYKELEQILKSKTKIQDFKTEMCLNCSENKWHQHIKSEKHQIFNLNIQDPFYFFNEASVNQKESCTEEIDHKTIQEKLSDLALGVEMEQTCLREMLENLNRQEKQAQSQLEQPNKADLQHFSLPVMPMLRSVFQYANKANKKTTHELGVQTNIIPEKATKIIEVLQPNLNEINSQKDKIQFKLITQIADKTVQIKELQSKIVQAEKIEFELKAQHNVLIEQNISLQKRNSILEGQLNLSKLKNVSNKFKLANKKKSLQKARQEISTAANSKVYNNQAHFNQQFSAQKQLDQIPTNKLRGTTPHDSKFKIQQTPNKTMFIPNLYQNPKIARQSITPGSVLSIERGSDKLEDQGLNSIVDFPSLRQSIHSSDPFHQKSYTIKLEDKKNQKELGSKQDQRYQFNKSKRKLKQITRKIINTQSGNIKEMIRSQNPSPQLEQKSIRRLGKIQNKQSLLKMLYDSQLKECNDKSLNFDHFKKGYENFVLKIVGMGELELEGPRAAKLKQLHKKSTVSIKQYYRNDFLQSKDEIIANQEAASNENIREGSKRYVRLSACFRDIMNNLFAEEDQQPPANYSSQSNNKIVLSNEQLRVITQILAYMIQLKVNNINAYTKMKTIISIESGEKKKSNFAEENKELRQSISAIIKNHRRCQCLEGLPYCKHISVFIKNTAALMEL